MILSRRAKLLHLIVAAIFCIPTVVYAEEIELWHGWLNLVPCSEVEWNNDGIFGTPSPTVRTGPQEFHGYIKADIDTDIEDMVRNCAITAAATTTAVLILTEGAGGWETFQASFYACMGERAANVADFQLETNTVCNWD
ncbi:hypothetical protein [Afipia sp. GAS231]|uniref:hypothetical protein n=1 Tax=Afipia sp. GAS231 TaxID=1882747 RepID=UPI00087A0089|nr:hypothetical protein [Afipia sp. GAS231]SDP37778.1 hypothetical protein SAMN05444050_6645 [Afipia sp. GAS231]